MGTVEVITCGPFPRLVIEDRAGERHEIEISRETLEELSWIGCDSCKADLGVFTR